MIIFVITFLSTNIVVNHLSIKNIWQTCEYLEVLLKKRVTGLTKNSANSRNIFQIMLYRHRNE